MQVDESSEYENYQLHFAAKLLRLSSGGVLSVHLDHFIDMVVHFEQTSAAISLEEEVVDCVHVCYADHVGAEADDNL